MTSPTTGSARPIRGTLMPLKNSTDRAYLTKVLQNYRPQLVVIEAARRSLRVLDQLWLTAKLRGGGPQRRCACPIHRRDARGRTFSVNLAENVFHCHDAPCGRHG